MVAGSKMVSRLGKPPFILRKRCAEVENQLPESLFLLTMIGNVSVLLYDFWLFDRLHQLQYTSHRSQWERDGQPGGFVWKPRDTASKALSSQWLMLAWLFATPQWIRGDSHALSLLYRYRAATAFWNLACLAQFYLLFGNRGTFH